MYCKVKNTFWHVFQVCFKNFLALNKVFNHLRNTSHWNKCYFYLYLHHWFHLSWALTWIFISVIHSIGKPKIKMYKTPEGSFKGDARCCYLKVCLNCITLIWWVFLPHSLFFGLFFFSWIIQKIHEIQNYHSSFKKEWKRFGFRSNSVFFLRSFSSSNLPIVLRVLIIFVKIYLH